MKGISWLLGALMVIGMVTAADHIVISEVLANPSGTESGGEAVELFNQANTSVDLSGYVIRTESSRTDATLPQGTIINANGYLLIADASWSSLKDNSSWPSADYEEAITLGNTNGAVGLVKNGTIIDAVSWGNSSSLSAELIETSPAKAAREGFSLSRSGEDTNNNSADLSDSIPNFKNKNAEEVIAENGTVLEIEVNVTNTAAELLNLSVEERVIPLPGEIKKVPLAAFVADEDGIESVESVNATVTGPAGFNQKISLISNQSGVEGFFSGEIEMEFFNQPGRYNVSVTVTDASGTSRKETSFEYVAIAAVRLDTERLVFDRTTVGAASRIEGDEDVGTDDAPTIQNAGNTPLDIGIYGSNLSSGAETISVSNLRFSLEEGFAGSLSAVLSSQATIVDANLEEGPSSVVPLGIEVTVPRGAKSGKYKGDVHIVAVRR